MIQLGEWHNQVAEYLLVQHITPHNGMEPSRILDVISTLSTASGLCSCQAPGLC